MASLIENLTACRKLLSNFDETFWVKEIDKALALLAQNSSQKRDFILSWYGGAGSFNDIVICKYNGHEIDETEEDRINDLLSELREVIFIQVNDL